MHHMNKRLVAVAAAGALAAPLALAEPPQYKDIAQMPVDVVGPGTVSVVTKGDTQLKFGGQVRIVPTRDSNWDFGAASSAGSAGGTSVLKQHVNEAGWVSNGYTRSEDRMYFSAMGNDQSWSFYTALEFDRPLDTASVDERGGKLDTSSDFGMERLLGTVALPGKNRLYAGWDVWGVDFQDADGFIYGDDNPGIWIKGSEGALSYSGGWWKLKENNFQNSPVFNLSANQDRDLYGGYLDYVPAPGQKLRALYLLDRSKGTAVTTIARRFSQPAALAALGTSDFTSSHLGAYWTGQVGNMTITGLGVYQYGSADVYAGSALAGKYDVRAFAVSGDISWKLKTGSGTPLTPIVGFLYTSGDKSGSDRKLGGYSGPTDLSRFGKWGGEELISTDTNFVLGTPLYGMLPTGLGNGTPIATGGIQNLQGTGFGRGDNPGLGMLAAGVKFSPAPGLFYKTNFRGYWWNQAQVVTSFVDPQVQNAVKAGYVGLEWSNDLTWQINKVVQIKAQLTFLLPGKAVEQANAALTATSAGLGREDAKVASRIGTELIWNF